MQESVCTLDDATDADGRREGTAAGGAVELLALLLGFAGCAQPAGVPGTSQLHRFRFFGNGKLRTPW